VARIDITGKRFGRLTVIKFMQAHETRRVALWLCRCDCGTEKVIRTDGLTSGSSKSCGCIQREKARENGAKVAAINNSRKAQEIKERIKKNIRRCPKCGEEKPIVGGYCQDSTRADGYDSYCIECRKAEKIVYYEKNKESILKQKRDLHKKDKSILKREYEKNKEKIKKKSVLYSKNNRGKINAYYRKRRKTDPRFRLRQRISAAIRLSLKTGKGGHKWETLVGYTVDDLLKRLKTTLPSGYKWEDYLNGKTDLHIDHIIPISAFNFDSYTDTDFRRCWSLKNLRLLQSHENQIKHKKLVTGHFQPCFKGI